MSPREARVIQNETLFREVNLHIMSLDEGPLSIVQDGLLPLVCECADTGCTIPIEVDRATFERIREDTQRFLVAPGHEDLDSESVVERRPGYLVVEKQST